jgi:tetratricopeptide (TPR) repeat protein
MSGKSSSSSSIVLGVVAVVAAGAGAALWWTHFAGSKEKEVEGDNAAASVVEAPIADSTDVVVEDVSDSDAPSDAEAAAKAEEEARLKAEADAHKEQYDHAISMADKFMKGQRYEQAAEKYSEAIDILPKVPSAAGNILPLYNNRSAMYEKSGPAFYDKALNDISLVLQLDQRHMKARVRRARIQEAKGKAKEALIDYTVHFYMEQAKGIMPTSSQKVEDISKAIAYEQATANFQAKLDEAFAKSGPYSASTSSVITHVCDLPSRSYIRSGLDSFPSLTKWKVQYGKTDLQDLIDAYNGAEWSVDKVAIQLEVVTCAIAAENYKTAFNYLSKPSVDDVDLAAAGRKDLLALRAQLMGLDMLLRCNLLGAAEYFKAAAGYLPGDVELAALCAETRLSLGYTDDAIEAFNHIMLTYLLGHPAMQQQGGGDGDGVEKTQEEEQQREFPLFSQYLESVPSADSPAISDIAAEVDGILSSECKVMAAYVLLLRANAWSARGAGEGLKMRDDPITPAQKDNELACALVETLLAETSTGSSGDRYYSDFVDVAARKVKVLSLCKRIHLLGQTKGLTGAAQTPEDVTACKQYVADAKAVDATNKTLSLLEIDVVAMEEKFEESLKMVETYLLNADKGEGIPYVIKANIVTHQGMTAAKNQAGEQATFALLKDASDLYDRALEEEPGCVEARAQACQLKCIVGDMEGAAALAEEVVKLARNRDEAMDLEHLKVQTSSQITALKEIYAGSGQA